MTQPTIKDLETILAQDYQNLTGLAVWKQGKPFYEYYAQGCSSASTLHVYSVTKSIVSILIGIAIDQGYLQSVHQKVLDFYPDFTIPEGAEQLQQITLQNMLTMTAPFDYTIPPYEAYFTSEDFVKFTLAYLGGSDPIGAFHYLPLVGPDLLSGILTKVTGTSLLAFAKEQLFTPLGITVDEAIQFQSAEEQIAFNSATNISGWVSDAHGSNTTGWGLTLSTTDMAKIGQLYLNGGVWQGQQIVSSQWIADSIKVHSRWEEANLSYGYLWWVLDEQKGCFAAMGDGGNTIYVNAEKDIVIAISSMFMPDAKDRIELIKGTLEPIFQ